MATLLRRKTLFYNQFRQMHRSTKKIGINMKHIVNEECIDGSSVPTFDMNTERKAFLEVLPEVINSVVTSPKLSELPEVGSWMKKLLEYTVGGGKLGRGLMVSIGYRMFEEPDNFLEETQHSARILGWCIEMLQVKFLILDDIADHGTSRRGKPCWHLQPNVGLTANTDALLIYQAMLDLLDMYFGRTPIYGDLLKYFNEAAYRATVSEHLDYWASYSKEKNNLHVLNMNLNNTIANHKSSQNTFKLPVLVALLLVKNGKKKATEELNNICMQFGRLLQCQDDYMDVYVNDSVTGKTGRDIQEGKCTWVAVTALQHCNDAQRAIFKEYYGSQDPEHVKRIKQLYDELHLPQLYEQHERTMYDDLMRQMQALPTEGERNFFLEVLNASYKRVC